LYVNRQGVEQDLNKGLSWIMEAANQEYEPARINVFKICLNLLMQGNTTTMHDMGYMRLND
jgi:TPR repeat protein